MLKLVFMGSDAIALPALDWLVGGGKGGAEFSAVYTQPDRPVGRGQKVQANAIKLWAEARGLPVFQPAKLTPKETARLAGLNADVALVMAYGHILKPYFIGTPRLGTLNLHASILPKYRGASPIQTAIASGERGTGVTLMRIVPELDAGPVADIERVSIAPLDTATEVEAKLAQACVPLLARSLPKLATGSLAFVEQVHAEATFCRRLEKSDGTLDFAASAAALAARINGLFPWPGCSIQIAGQPVKLGLADHPGDCHLIDDKLRAPAGAGTVLGADAEGLLVATGQGTLRLRRLQRPGGRMLLAAEFLRGFPVPAGATLRSQPMPSLVAARAFPRPAT